MVGRARSATRPPAAAPTHSPAASRRRSAAAARRHARSQGCGSGGSSSRRRRRGRASRSRSPRRSPLSPSVRPSRHCACTAPAVRRATSSQTFCPDGASAAWGTVRPSASATTCAVAAVPRNWQPPPGEAQARQPRSAAVCRSTRPCANRAPSVCTAPASSPLAGRQGDAAGHDGAGEIAERRQRHRHRGQSLVAGADPITPRRQRQAADESSQHDRRIVAVRQGVEHPCRPLAAAVARIRHRRREGQPAQPVELERCLAHEQADLPVPRVVPERDGRAVVVPETALGGEDEELVAPDLRRLPTHAGVLREAEHVARRAVAQELGGQRERTGRPVGRRCGRRRGRACPPPSPAQL